MTTSITQHRFSADIAPPTASEALQAAGLDFDVGKVPVYLGNGAQVPGRFATMRSDNGAPLGIVGARYEILQHTTALGLFDPFVARGMRYVGAGSFKGGALVYVQAALPGGAVKVAGDEMARNLTLVANHDGTGALRLFLTAVRIICYNTLQAALQDAKGQGYTFRHTASSAHKLERAALALRDAEAEFGRFGALADSLAAARWTLQDSRDMVAQLLPARESTDGPEVTTRTENARAKIIDLTETGIGLAPHRGTAWAALNAVTQYVDHERSTRGDDAKRALSAMMGTGAAMKSAALAFIAGRALGADIGAVPLLATGASAD